MRRLPILALALVPLLSRSAPEFEVPPPIRVEEAGDPWTVEGARFGFELPREIKGVPDGARVTFLWSIVQAPRDANIITVPSATVLNNPNNQRRSVGFEVDRAGSYTIRVKAQANGEAAERSVTVQVRNRLQLLTAAVPPAVAGQRYSVRFMAQAGEKPYRFTLDGPLPPGLTAGPEGLAGIPGQGTAREWPVTLRVQDAAGAVESTKLTVRLADGPQPWGMLNIGSSFTPRDGPLRAAAEHLGWQRHGWTLERGGTVGVGIGETWSRDFRQRWLMLDALRSGKFGVLFLHQGRAWEGTSSALALSDGGVTDLGALVAVASAAREVLPFHDWPVFFNAYWPWEIDSRGEIDESYLLDGTDIDRTIAYYDGSLRRAYHATLALQRPVFLIPVGPVIQEVRNVIAANQLPSIASTWDIYSGDGRTYWDGGHLSQFGGTLFAQTYFAQVYQVDPRTLPFQFRQGVDSFVFGHDATRKPTRQGTVSSAEARRLQELIFNIVRGDPFSGFNRPQEIPAYLADMKRKMGWWETFDNGEAADTSGIIRGDDGRVWTGKPAAHLIVRKGSAAVTINPGGKLSTNVDEPFDVLCIETAENQQDPGWRLDIYANEMKIGSLPASAGTGVDGRVSRWVLRDLRSKLPPGAFTLTFAAGPERSVTVDNIKLRQSATYDWMLKR